MLIRHKSKADRSIMTGFIGCTDERKQLFETRGNALEIENPSLTRQMLILLSAVQATACTATQWWRMSPSDRSSPDVRIRVGGKLCATQRYTKGPIRRPLPDRANARRSVNVALHIVRMRVNPQTCDRLPKHRLLNNREGVKNPTTVCEEGSLQDRPSQTTLDTVLEAPWWRNDQARRIYRTAVGVRLHFNGRVVY